VLHDNILNDIDLIMKQINFIEYEIHSESDETNAGLCELNDSLEVPIEENEPKFEVENFEKVLNHLEVKLSIKSFYLN